MVTYFILQAYTGTCEPARANTGKTWERFGNNAGEWTGRVEISEEEIPGSKHSLYDCTISWPTPGFKGGTFKLCVLNRWEFNLCVHSSPLWIRI